MIIDFNTAARQSYHVPMVDAMADNGFTVDSVISDGNFHRFGPKNAHWYVTNGVHGSFGSWKDDTRFNWSANGHKQDMEWLAHVQEKEQAERAQSQKEAAKDAEETWLKAKTGEAHPYLEAKGVTVSEIRLKSGDLLIPGYAADGSIQTYQRIKPDGSKRFCPGSKVSGARYVIQGQGQTAIVEGYSTGLSVHMATGWTVVVAFNAGNMPEVAKDYPGAVVCGDNDFKNKVNIGLEKAMACGLPYLVPPEPFVDWNDVHAAEGIEKLKAMLQPKVKSGLEAPCVDDAMRSHKPLKWLVKSYMDQITMSSIFAPPGAAKTFVAIDIGLSIACGNPWHGNRTSKGAVLYVCGEGYSGVLRRAKAWFIHHEIPSSGVQFRITNKSVHFLDRQSVAGLVQLIDTFEKKPVLIIVDTLARNFGPGDENFAGDMSRFVDELDEVKRRYKCAILIVHHTGLADQTRGRGSSVLKGALEWEYQLSKDGDNVSMACTKSKDGDVPPEINFAAKVVDTGWIDEDGDPLTSLVLEEGEAVVKRRKPLSDKRKIAYRVLVEMIKQKTSTFDFNLVWVGAQEWRDEALSMGLSASDNRDNQRRYFTKTVEWLVANDYVVAKNGKYRTV